MGADFCELLHFKHLDTRLHSSVTKGITPDILLTGMGECVGVHSSQSKEMLSIYGATSSTDNLNGEKGQIKRK